MAGKTAVFETLIRESHLDSFGHVNNAVYLELLEQARWEMITAGGLGLAEVQARRQGPVVLEVTLRLRRELRLRDRIRIETHVEDTKRIVFHIRQEIFNAQGVRCTEADFKFGIFHLDERRLLRPDDVWRKALQMEPLSPPAV